MQSSWVAEAISCAQQFIHAVYRQLEPGYGQTPLSPEAQQNWERNLQLWKLYSNYPDWVAVTKIRCYPENYITPFVRQRKTNLFKALENDLNQTRLNSDSVQRALQNYLQGFEQICNLDVLSSYMDGATPMHADYYFIGRQRVPPFQYFWRKAEIELSPGGTAINPVAWGNGRQLRSARATACWTFARCFGADGCACCGRSCVTRSSRYSATRQSCVCHTNSRSIWRS